jgi:hypothetical protein
VGRGTTSMPESGEVGRKEVTLPSSWSPVPSPTEGEREMSATPRPGGLPAIAGRSSQPQGQRAVRSTPLAGGISLATPALGWERKPRGATPPPCVAAGSTARHGANAAPRKAITISHATTRSARISQGHSTAARDWRLRPFTASPTPGAETVLAPPRECGSVLNDATGKMFATLRKVSRGDSAVRRRRARDRPGTCPARSSRPRLPPDERSWPLRPAPLPLPSHALHDPPAGLRTVQFQGLARAGACPLPAHERNPAGTPRTPGLTPLPRKGN